MEKFSTEDLSHINVYFLWTPCSISFCLLVDGVRNPGFSDPRICLSISGVWIDFVVCWLSIWVCVSISISYTPVSGLSLWFHSGSIQGLKIALFSAVLSRVVFYSRKFRLKLWKVRMLVNILMQVAPTDYYHLDIQDLIQQEKDPFCSV